MSSVLVKQFFNAWHTYNLEKMVSFFAEDAVLQYVGGPPYGRRIEGRKEITRFYQGVLSASERLKLNVHMPYCTCIQSGSTVVCLSCIRITVPEREWAVDCPSADVFEFSGGKIHRLTLYIATPEGARIGAIDLKKDLAVEDMGELAAAAWAIA